MSKLVYKKVRYLHTSLEYNRLVNGTYSPPEGWRVHSMGMSESANCYDGYIHLLLEASVPDGAPYRG